jgi:hypothetical protein
VVIVHGDADLLQVVHALGPPRRLAGGLHGGQEQGDQDGDDRDDDQQFDQGKSATVMHLDAPQGRTRGLRPDAKPATRRAWITQTAMLCSFAGCDLARSAPWVCVRPGSGYVVDDGTGSGEGVAFRGLIEA